MSYEHCSVMERAKIELLHQQGWSFTAIGKELNRHRTTVSREIERNRHQGVYDAQTAQARYEKRRKACCPKTKLGYTPLKEYVTDKIALHRWSPELVAGCLRLEYPDSPRMHLCHETIYQAIYANRHQLDFLQEFLAQARPKRRKRGQSKTRRGSTIPHRVSICERPASVDARTEIGHWEGDLIVGKGQDGFILTLVERTSRLLHAVTTKTRRAGEVCRAVIQALIDRPISWVKTITFDNGTEFSEHQRMAQALGVRIYFADPYSAYQRGTNEQVNGLIRRYLPKGTRFKHLTHEQLQQIVHDLNTRPRKCLGYRTPLQVFQCQRLQLLRALST